MRIGSSIQLKSKIDTLRHRYWFFMSQKPPRIKAANACLIELRPLMQKQLERECRADRRHRPASIDIDIDIDDCTEMYS